MFFPRLVIGLMWINICPLQSQNAIDQILWEKNRAALPKLWFHYISKWFEVILNHTVDRSYTPGYCNLELSQSYFIKRLMLNLIYVTICMNSELSSY